MRRWVLGSGAIIGLVLTAAGHAATPKAKVVDGVGYFTIDGAEYPQTGLAVMFYDAACSAPEILSRDGASKHKVFLDAGSATKAGGAVTTAFEELKANKARFGVRLRDEYFLAPPGEHTAKAAFYGPCSNSAASPVKAPTCTGPARTTRATFEARKTYIMNCTPATVGWLFAVQDVATIAYGARITGLPKPPPPPLP